jgi:hypothetical protein
MMSLIRIDYAVGADGQRVITDESDSTNTLDRYIGTVERATNCVNRARSVGTWSETSRCTATSVEDRAKKLLGLFIEASWSCGHTGVALGLAT